MKIKKLVAEGVHGYLPLEIDFFEDLTFLTGLNGSGKTSALRLLMALLTPNLEELGAITYTSALVTVTEAGETIQVSAKRVAEGVALSISTMEGSLTISSAELELLQEAKRREEPRSPVMEKYLSNPIYQALRTISTPMFLGLDRRFSAPGVGVSIPRQSRGH
jgi:predicted ATP-binding protein involved in virulence